MRACNLQGAGGRARSPTPWGGTSQETPYLAYGPELDASYREAPRRASSWKLKMLVYQHEWYVPHKGWDIGAKGWYGTGKAVLGRSPWIRTCTMSGPRRTKKRRRGDDEGGPSGSNFAGLPAGAGWA